MNPVVTAECAPNWWGLTWSCSRRSCWPTLFTPSVVWIVPRPKMSSSSETASQSERGTRYKYWYQWNILHLLTLTYTKLLFLIPTERFLQNGFFPLFFMAGIFWFMEWYKEKSIIVTNYYTKTNCIMVEANRESFVMISISQMTLIVSPLNSKIAVGFIIVWMYSITNLLLAAISYLLYSFYHLFRDFLQFWCSPKPTDRLQTPSLFLVVMSNLTHIHPTWEVEENHSSDNKINEGKMRMGSLWFRGFFNQKEVIYCSHDL